MPLIYHPNLKFLSGNECGWGCISLWLILNDSKLLPPFSFGIEGLHQPPVNICIPCFISVKEVASGTIWHDNGFKVSALIANIYYQYVKQYNNIKLSNYIEGDLQRGTESTQLHSRFRYPAFTTTYTIDSFN